MEILLIKPYMKKALWAGTRLLDEYGYEFNEDRAAEAWVLSAHEEGQSVVANGKYEGKFLNEVIEAEGKGILGTNAADKNGFPILIKFIDAGDKLSIQVHPDDEYASNYKGENGKTEAWYIIDTAPGAEIIYGPAENMTPDEFAQAIKDKTLPEKLRHIEVHSGDVVFIPSKMIHAIGKGVLLAEVQQSSNTTYRIYDYDRLEPDGTHRPLHVKKASEVSDLTVRDIAFSPAGKTERIEDADVTYLTGCQYFKMTSLKINGKYSSFADETGFVSLVVIDGEGTVSCPGEKWEIRKGSSVFIPAGKGKFEIEGKALNILESRI